jgi:arsenite methyltransferase
MSRFARPNYGIDAPGLMRFFFGSGVAAIILSLLSSAFLVAWPVWSLAATWLFGVAGCYLLGMGSLMVYESKVTKVADRDVILDGISWRGDEQVLDVGCGRGLLLVGAAKRLRTGRAVGVDIWQASDQSGNNPHATLENAKIESVEDRVDIQTADMRHLPFPDASFDIVMSHWVVHNLALAVERHTALNEMIRVLRPGGTLILTDIEHRRAYVDYINAHGLGDVRVIVNRVKDLILAAVSFGSFRPATILARKLA